MKTKQMVDNLGLRVSVYVRACVRVCVRDFRFTNDMCESSNRSI